MPHELIVLQRPGGPTYLSVLEVKKDGTFPNSFFQGVKDILGLRVKLKRRRLN